MKIFKHFFLEKKQKFVAKQNSNQILANHEEIGRFVKEARINNNFTTKELSRITRIPENIINAIENNIENQIPEYPFIRSILYKLEDCLSLTKNILVSKIIRDEKTSNKDKRRFIVRKFDFINTWQGSVFYFLILIMSIFMLKRYFIVNLNFIEIQNIQEKIKVK